MVNEDIGLEEIHKRESGKRMENGSKRLASERPN